MTRIKLKMVVGTLVGFSAVFSGLVHGDIRAGSLEPPPPPMRVTVSFGGLMVFEKEGTAGYKISVAVAAGHDLKALVDGENRGTPPITPDASWFLEVTGPSPTGVSTIEVGHEMVERYPDSVTGQYDRSWMIDLNLLHYQDKDFPRGGFTIRRDKVKPIIHLNQGILYSGLKTEDMESTRDPGPEEHRNYLAFGFFAETVALDLEIPEGQALVFRPERGEIYRLLPYQYGPQPTHQVQIKNTRNSVHTETSDFRQYYGLFNETQSPTFAKYDFRERPSPRGRPHNPVRRPKAVPTMPGMTKMKGTLKKNVKPQIVTCCGLECNPIYLGPITR